MPEILVRLRWPDGDVQQVYSPSLVVADHVSEGVGYRVDEFVSTMTAALNQASDRVQATYGFPCSRAAFSIAQVTARAEGFRADQTVLVEGFGPS